jgi:N-methylhydantoinase B/oxoprolinase/acetone carboxylase alpha subunit
MPMKKSIIRTKFEHWIQEKKVTVRASCVDVALDEVWDLKFAFFDEDDQPVEVQFDLEEFEELQDLCIEKLSDAKDELIYEQLDSEKDLFTNWMD